MKTKQKRSTNYDYFIHLDTSAYKGEWVAIADNKVVSHGKDAQVVYNGARKKYHPTKISLAKVPDEQILVLPCSS